MVNREGQLKRQPLFYVLASVRFEAWLSLADKIPEIQSRLRDFLPISANLLHTAMGVNVGADVPRDRQSWAFHTANRLLGCHILPDQIIVHALEYSGFAAFSKTISSVVDAVLMSAGHLDCRSIGIRYLDLIQPEEGETLDQYVPAGILPFSNDKLRAKQFKDIGGISQASYRTEDGVLQARFWTGQDLSFVPDDLIPLYLLTKDPGSMRQQGIPPLSPGAGILDSDSIWMAQVPSKLTTDEIIGKLTNLHGHATSYFRSVCTEHAFEVWQGEN